MVAVRGGSLVGMDEAERRVFVLDEPHTPVGPFLQLASKRWYAALDALNYATYKMCNERLIYHKDGEVVSFTQHPRGYSIHHVRTHYYQIVDTDYDTWAIEHICSERGSNFVLLLSRKMKDVPNDVMWKVRRSIRKAGVIKGSTWFASGCLTGKGSEDFINNLSLVRGPL
ncbi:hypothetical protein HPB51_010581 [Rhipicephalus microplus]|uniref:Uncharacterized protein n=1 Tax=Rhipicephalus microplus TaxID=6941 RepID=A0A9J6E8L0_RHIMP|nr:hypothetical protein HPB51_010581 [Rhipicephalus microplus]